MTAAPVSPPIPASNATAPPLRLLASFAFFAGDRLQQILNYAALKCPSIEVFADSGAFSAHVHGTTVMMRDYLAWLERYRPVLRTYCALDVIGNARATDAALAEMEDLGLTPLPVFHFGSPWPVLERYVERYRYVALGGIAVRRRLPVGWTARCFQIARKTGTVFHAFGITNWPAMRAFAWYSADSSSWVAPSRFGQLKLFDARTATYEQPHVGGARATNRQKIASHASVLRRAGADPGAMMRDAAIAGRMPKAHYRDAFVAAVGSFAEMERWLRMNRAPIDNGTDDPGFKLYYALSAGFDLNRILIDGFCQWHQLT